MGEHKGNIVKRADVASIMARIATEKTGLRITTARLRKRSRARVRFYAVDGALCVLIEAESEEDGRALCRDVKLDFIGLFET